jgi:hypothetical protein
MGPCHFEESAVMCSYVVLSSKEGVAFLQGVEFQGPMLILGGPTGRTPCRCLEFIVLSSVR